MKIARYDGDRLGILDGHDLVDVTYTVDSWPGEGWPGTPGDALIRNLDRLTAATAGSQYAAAPRQPVMGVALDHPVVAPTKVMAAPANYADHVAVDAADPGIDHGVHRNQLEGLDRPAEALGLFLKATSSLTGPARGVELPATGARIDFEAEVVAVVGRSLRNVSAADALDGLAAYCLGLDMSVRGKQDRSWRKSCDTFTVLGPWLTTADEVENPEDLEFWLDLNGERRQSSSTRHMTVPLADLVALASANYTLHPGDLIFTGTPVGVGPVAADDVLVAGSPVLGTMTVPISGPART